MQKTMKLTRTVAALALSLLLVLGCTALPGTTLTAKAASNLTSLGLGEHALKAYREDWQYYYGGVGNFGSNGLRNSDCSGLIYSYFCWVDDESNIKMNYSYPRTVEAQANASSASGPISTMPRTHGLIVTIENYDHVGVYVGGGMVADNSTWGVNMRYRPLSQGSWIQWHKLKDLTYPTTGWYKFDGDYFYYENGQYVVNTTRTEDGVTYTFGSDGKSDKTPSNFTNSGYDTPGSDYNARTTTDVRLREGPGTSYSTLAVLSPGAYINVTSTANKEWYAVTTSSGQKGYMHSDYIKLTGDVPEDGGDSTPTPPAPAEGKAATTTTAVNLRSGKGTSYSSLGVIPNGTAITVTDTSDSGWYGVTVNGKSGYMSSEYIKLSSTDATPTPTPTPPAQTESRSAKTTADVNLRSGRGTNYSSKGVIDSGTAITVTDTSNSGWYGVTVNGKTGYMSSDYIKFTDDSGSTTPPAETPPAGNESTSGKTTTYVNLRSGRGTSYSSLGVIPTGTALTITDTSDSAWYGVTVNGKSGYMSSQYISTASGGTAPSGDTMKTTAYLNLRKGAGTSNAVIMTIPSGASVTVLEKTSSDWYKISYNGSTGYSASQYLK